MLSSKQLVTLVTIYKAGYYKHTVANSYSDRPRALERDNPTLGGLVAEGLLSKQLMVRSWRCNDVWQLRVTEKGQRFLASCTPPELIHAFTDVGNISKAVQLVTRLNKYELPEFLTHSNVVIRRTACRRMEFQDTGS